MLLSEIWKEKTKEIIKLVWKEKIPEASIDKYLDNIIEKRKAGFPILKMRNIYTNQGLEIPLNDVFNVVKDEDLCIEGNNTLTYSYRKVKSPIPKILIHLKSQRDIHKKKAKELSEQMTQMRKEGISTDDPKYIEIEILWSVEDSLEKAIKIIMNSIYGVQGQNGSIIYSPDTAGAVTSQGRALISEMMWSIERFLYGTIHFTSFSEFFAFLNQILKEVDYSEPLLQYITYIPKPSDVRKKFISLIKNIPDLYQEIDSIEVSLYHFISNLDETQRIYLYYKCDFFKLILNNPRIENIVNSMLEDPASYNSISDRDTPPQFIPSLKLLGSLVEKFIIIKMATANRTIKYEIKRRKGIILSDTDSVVINLQPYVKRLSERFFKRQGLDASQSEHLAFSNEQMCFKIVNIMSYLCTHVTKVTSDIFCKASNIPEELRQWISMKNEFYFMRMVIYTNSKKNYICYVRLNEGKIQDEVAATGIKLNSLILNTYVHDKMMDVIENKILKSKDINPSIILHDIKTLEHSIINSIMNGDITYGKKGRYSGPKGYKSPHTKKTEGKINAVNEVISGVYTNSIGRSCYIWNLLYPASKINIGDYAYRFNLTLEDEQSLEKLKVKYPSEYERVKALIFNNKNEPHLARFGLRSIAIPITDTITSIPEWIIEFIDYEEITNKTLQPIVSLLPSIGIHKSRISSTKSTYSPLISF